MNEFTDGKIKHICILDSLVAGGTPEEVGRGIYKCRCGVRWTEVKICRQAEKAKQERTQAKGGNNA
jgi:hypothetical protein